MSENSTGNIAIDGVIDAGWTSYFDADKHGTKTMSETETTGRTIGGSTSDDYGKVTTENWPSHIDPDDVNTDLQKEVIKVAALHRDKSQVKIADIVGCTAPSVSNTLRKYWPPHPTVGAQGRPSGAGETSADEATSDDADEANSSETNPSEADGGTDLTRVKTAAEAIHSTATHQETRDAVMHLLDLCPGDSTLHE